MENSYTFNYFDKMLELLYFISDRGRNILTTPTFPKQSGA